MQLHLMSICDMERIAQALQMGFDPAQHNRIQPLLIPHIPTGVETVL